MKVSAHVRITGPLAEFAGGFAAELTGQGYTDLSLANQLRLMADLSGWIDRRKKAVDELTSEVVEQFVSMRRRTHTGLMSRRAVAPLLAYLRSIGVAPLERETKPRRSELLRRYERHLEERGLVVQTQTFRLQVAEEFLQGRNASALTSADVTHCVSAYAGKPASLPIWLTALRSLLRFLLLAGETAVPLVHAVPSAPRWRQTSLPQGLERGEIAVVLGTCDRRTTIGRRDYAALLLMVRLGLRAGEVAALTLDDIDWELGELVVQGKGRTTGRLPLPVDVGEALVAHLRRRRRGAGSRAVFLQSRAPYRASRSATIKTLATKALRAAGIVRGGAHRLRHTAATQMLRRGASLTEIAQVLRHRHIDTTAIYARVDHVQLRTLAQPWPSNVLGRDRLRALVQRWPGGAA